MKATVSYINEQTLIDGKHDVRMRKDEVDTKGRFKEGRA